MRILEGNEVFLSASDLMRFMGCTHATTLDLAYMRGNGPVPRADSDDAALLQKQGDAHEAAHLAKLKASGMSVIEIARSDLVENAQDTREALKQGPQIVFQGALLGKKWGGWSDFLERVETPSNLGSFSYEVTDTKLKRHPHPKHVLQLVLYSDLLAQVQNVVPEFAHVELGDESVRAYASPTIKLMPVWRASGLKPFWKIRCRPGQFPVRIAACAGGAIIAKASGKPRTAYSTSPILHAPRLKSLRRPELTLWRLWLKLIILFAAWLTLLVRD